MDFEHIALIQLLQGLGLALFIMPINSILLSDLKPDEIAAGSGLSTFLRTLGASFAVSITSFLWERRAVQHHAQITESISVFDPAVRQQLRVLGQGDPQTGYQLLDRMIDSQAYQISFNDVAFALGWVYIAVIVLVWLAKPPFGPRPGGGASAGAKR